MRTPKHLQNPNYQRNHLGQPAQPRRRPAADRTVFLDHSVSMWAWPSRGGLVVLEHVTALDFEFLGLDPVHPPMRRAPDQETEDQFCQQLLLLGAKWFDSRERYGFVANVENDEEPEILAIEAGEEPVPTLMEKRWVSVGYPAEVDGGFWVAEYDTPGYGIQQKHNLVPDGASRVLLAKTMDEKCEILESMGAVFYTSMENYDGAACLNAWKTKTDGEVGPLLQTTYEEE